MNYLKPSLLLTARILLVLYTIVRPGNEANLDLLALSTLEKGQGSSYTDCTLHIQPTGILSWYFPLIFADSAHLTSAVKKVQEQVAIMYIVHLCA